jgi:hypothetical protein
VTQFTYLGAVLQLPDDAILSILHLKKMYPIKRFNESE